MASLCRRLLPLVVMLALAAFSVHTSEAANLLQPPPLPRQAPPTQPPPQAQQPDDRPRLVRSQTDVFAVFGRTRRWVTSPQLFTDYRFREEWIEQITDDELSGIRRGPDLIAGPVLRAPDGELWIVYQGSRRRVAGPDAFGPLALAPEDAIPATEAALASYPTARAVGNVSRPWMGAVVGAVLLWAGWLLWRTSGPTHHQAATVHPTEGLPWLATRLIHSAWPLLSLVLATALLKLYFVTLYPWLPDGADAGSYVTVARYLAAGGSVMQDGPFGGLIGVTSPLYPMILAALSFAVRLTGGSVVGWKLVQAGVAVLLVPLMGDLGWRLFGPRAGRAVVIIAASSPLWLYSAELLQYELWLALFITAGLWALVRWLATPDGAMARPIGAGALARRDAGWLALAGVCLGLASLMQLKVVVLLGLGFLTVAITLWRRLNPAVRREPRVDGAGTGWASWATAAALLALFAVPGVLPLGAWGLRNVAVHGEPLLGSHAAGIIFWMGNHAGATGGIMQVPRPDAYYERARKYPEGSITREARAFSELAWEYIGQNPSRFALLGLSKLERFWWTITPDRLGAFAEDRTVAFLGGTVDQTAVRLFSKLAHLAAVCLVLVGALWGIQQLPADSGADVSVNAGTATGTAPAVAGVLAGRWLLLAAIAVFWLVHIPFISEPRYRLPIAPLLQVLEGTGAALVLAGVRHRLGGQSASK